ncbi:MAG: twin-arginine translocation signal domain-containing protein [Solirubrobacteraceae bacterium]|jgi:hypothetical protein
MSHLTRRGFVKSSAATTAGMTVFGGLLVDSADARDKDLGDPGKDPVVAVVKDPRKGHIAVMVGDREVNVHDPKLAARIARAAR